LSELSGVRFSELQAVIEANHFVQEAQFGLHRLFVLSLDPENHAIVEASKEELLVKIQSALDVLSSVSLKKSESDPDKKQFVDAVNLLRHYEVVVVKNLSLKLGVHETASVNSLLDPLLTLDSSFDVLSWQLSSLVTGQRKLFVSAFEQSTQLYQDKILLLIVIALLSFGLLLSMAWVIVKNIQANVEKIRIAAADIFSGNFSRRVVVSTNDETGQAAKAFNILIDAVSEKISLLERVNQQLKVEMVERLQAEDGLRHSENRYRQLIDMLPEGVVIESDGLINYVNHAALVLFSASSVHEVLGQPFSKFVTMSSVSMFHDGANELGVVQHSIEAMLKLSVAASVSIEVAKTSFQFGGKRTIQYVIHDITKHKHYEEQLLKQAQHDALTNLPNRAYLVNKLDAFISSAQKTQRKFYVLFIDIDNFKVVNDSLGHDIGDELLRAVATRMKLCIRDHDFLARLGGDEFVLVLGGELSEVGLELLTQRLLGYVAEPLILKGQELSVTCSIGCSVYPDDGEDAINLLKHADAAMYQAKNRGRNNLQKYQAEMFEKVSERLMLESQLRQAIGRNEFLLHYQPQLDLKTGLVIGAEALLRWQHPTLGLVSPAKFIPIAEDSGLIVPIGELVLNMACVQLRAWLDAGYPDFKVSVNVSAGQLALPNFVETVSNALMVNQLPATSLELELTESLSMRNPERTVSLLQRIRAIGVDIAIDDFGTGYSNLAYLKKFPIQRLKLDRSFISELVEDNANQSIIHSVIQMCQGLHLKVVAEGVEILGQLNLLKEYGCDEIQGYYFSPPVPADKFAFFLEKNRLIQLQHEEGYLYSI
jgi:diguanylate cyclase (GGDEF)-like protein/PAS domain S-box-containing protein